MMSFIQELQWRGMLHDMIPGTDALLASPGCAGYIGFDPTADSLGVGNLVQVMTLLHFQRAGHQPVALIGGATGMVGDPSGKSAERSLLNEDQLRHNQECQRLQLEKYMNHREGGLPIKMVNNYEWFREMGFLEFIRDVGKRLTVNYMMAKDSVKSRLTGDHREGMSFTEFTYQLIQGYDFYYLWKNHGIRLQMGGSDQWGNITTGTELIRRIEGGEAFALTTPLIKKADGTKFGKTEGGNVWLSPERTSPYKFYQFWINSTDADVANYIRIFSLKGREEIEALEQEHLKDPGQRLLQRELAGEITTMVHSAEALEQAMAASRILFGQSAPEQLQALSERDILELFEGVPQGVVSKAAIEAGSGIVEILAGSGFMSSNGEARRAIQENSVSVNKAKAGADRVISGSDLLLGKYILLQRGKKHYFLLRAE